MTPMDLTGQRFGRLTVLAFARRDENRQRHWRCQCDCGNEKTVTGAALNSGATRSCGCLKLETTRARVGDLCAAASESRRKAVATRVDPVVDALRRARIKRGLSRPAMETLSGYGANQLRNWEQGLSQMSITGARDLAQAIGVKLNVTVEEI